jgi:CheY-like chemotaxis protein
MPTSPTILVVEHEAVIAAALVDVLHEAGYGASFATESLTALAIAVTRPPDLIIADAVHVLDNLDLIRALHITPQLRHIPILVLHDSGSQAIALASVANAMLPKPFTVEALRGCVAQLLRQE